MSWESSGGGSQAQPFSRDEFGNKPVASAIVGPVKNLRCPGCMGAEKFLVGCHANTTQIKPVGIPTRHDRGITGSQTISVKTAGNFQCGKILITQIEILTSK